jgi:vitamin B12 transporter
MDVKNARGAWMMTCALVTTGASGIAATAVAQEAELPPIVVEGATLAIPPEKSARKGKAEAAPESDTAGEVMSETGESAAPASLEPGEAAGETINGVEGDKLGSAVSVVTGAELKARQIRHAADALRSLPGVNVSSQGGPQNLTVVRIRGAESNQTLVRIDGVEVNSVGDGIFDFSNLLVDDIAQIEVIRGPQSGLYSSGAIGGVINIITNGGKGPLTFRARGEGGSFGTWNGSASVSGGTDRAHGSLVVSGIRTDGFNIAPEGPEDDGGDFTTVSFTGGLLVFDNLKLDASLRRATREGDRDDFSGINAAGFFTASDDLSVFSTDLSVGRLAATLDTFSDGRWTQQLYAQGSETDNSDLSRGLFDPPDGTQSRNISTMSEYGYLTTYRLDAGGGLPVQHFLTGLAVHRNEGFDQPLLARDFERDRDSLAGEIRGEYFNAVSLVGNIRKDFNEGFEDFTTWRTTASVRPWSSSPFRLHGSYGTGVKYPSFAEQFGDFPNFIPNANLRPEEAEGWDAGIETTLWNGNAVVDVTYFDTELTNEIDTNFLFVNGQFFSTPFNRAGTSTRKGIEVQARTQVTTGLTVGLAYTYLNAEEGDGTQEIRRPPHSGRMDVNYTFDSERANINLAAIYNGDMDDLAFSFTDTVVTTLDEYWLVNVAASYKLSPGVEIYGRVENLLNEDYQEIFGYETADIAVYAGLRFTYVEEATRAWAEGR